MRNLLNFLLKYDYWLLFILLEVVSFTLLFRFNRFQGSVFFTSANQVAGRVDKTISEITAYFGLRQVNHDLVNRNVELELEVSRLSGMLREYMRDTTAIHALRQDVLGDYEIHEAQVVNNSLTQSNNYVTIDKGSADGIQAEMGVLNGSSVVGIVYQTSRHYALVLPILNTRTSISCKIARTDYFGILKWDGGTSRHAWLQDIPRHAEFTLGDTIVTSGHSAVFPDGIPVGVVDDRKDSQDGLSYLLKVRLFTDFARLKDVNVIHYKEQAEQTTLEKSIQTN